MIKQKKILRLYRPHRGQAALHDSVARFRVAACGRRWGKTIASTAEIIKSAWEKPHSVSFWVAPVYRQSMIAFDLARKGVPKRALGSINRTERKITLINGSTIEFKSAEIPHTLRGFGIDFLVVDEAAFLPRELWEEVLRPALSDRRGRALFVGTPKGKNWFFSLFSKGRDRGEENWDSFSFPTSDNPLIPASEIEDAKNSLPERVFRQEYLAQFVGDASSVFSDIARIVRGKLDGPLPHQTYSGGLDIARYRDYTVLVILDSRGSLVYFDRFTNVSFRIMKERVVMAMRRYHNAPLWVDSTGVGDPILEELRRMGAAARGFRFTASSKAALVENLILNIEEEKITIPPIPELIDELFMFGATTTPTGGVHYGAPVGYHDDCVIALALAAWGQRGVTVRQSDFPVAGF